MKQLEIWDSLYQKNLRWKLETRSLPKIFKGKRVLELGAGNGKTLRSLISQKPKVLVAVDFSASALKIIKKEFPKVKTVKSSITSLPFEDNTFDFVISYYTLNNLLEKDRKKSVSEIYRILKSSGRLLFEDFSVGDFRQLKFDKALEENTIKKSNGLICHFFNKEEISSLFSKFNKIKIKVKKSSPIRHKSHLHRVLISATIKK